MKKLLIGTALIAAGFGAGLLARPVFLEAAMAIAPLAATANGDTNGDGKRDLADAVSLLNWLFAGGPEPVPIQAPPAERFTDHDDGTVTDTFSGRLWQEVTADINGDGKIDPATDAVSFDEAMTFVTNLRLGGYADWRLPYQSELSAIVDVNRRGDEPSIDPVFESQTASYWVNSSNAGDPCHGSQFVVSFSYGSVALVGSRGPEVRALVRAVREPQ
ncbi:MAG TPA: DUF1566 domain-containing protein [Planctomycetota bacterium]|nr:DUF1566 domain-containing protein [Planctomycetota bacterium]